MNFKLDWFLIICIVMLLATLFCCSPKRSLDAPRLCSRIEHTMDILQDLREISQNIDIKDATDYFEPIEGCGKNILPRNDINLLGIILETKTQQAYEILNQLLIDINRA